MCVCVCVCVCVCCRFFTSRPQMEEFLASLLHFQHFRQFINSRIDQLKNRSVNRDLFDIEAMFYDEGLYTCVVCTYPLLCMHVLLKCTYPLLCECV